MAQAHYSGAQNKAKDRQHQAHLRKRTKYRASKRREVNKKRRMATQHRKEEKKRQKLLKRKNEGQK